MAWNCQGLGLDSAVGKFRDLVRSYNPVVVFSSETKKKACAMDRLKWSLGFKDGVAVDCVGKSGGFTLWCGDNVKVSVRPWCQNFIDGVMEIDGKSFRITGFYGEPKTELRSKSWDALRYLRRKDNQPWLCVGDYNEALLQSKKFGGKAMSFSHMEDFRECLADCVLAELGFHGYPDT